MGKLSIKTALTAGAVIASLSAANAASPNAMRSVGTAIEGAFVSEGRPTLAPFAQVRFCLSNPVDCEKSDVEPAAPDDKKARQMLQQVNVQVNSSIIGRNDKKNGKSVDIWQVGAKSGDCEDYALTKRRILMSKGYPAAALRIAVAYTSSGEGHAVLIAKTATGDVVLDNRTNVIKSWRNADLRWVKIQSGSNPHLWYTM
ncbi:hypothetical protein RU07_22445 [Agrobacterium tumefaciens]|uniref:Transglutaminase n=1 Tax=Agrobacterium tumefaciens TaxID=358 RepID=A0A0D0IY60_AGRTU|nr:transglutaminase-like cysteine peptidase [Rhizobium skierniewicense]KIP98150.1 hypothetical protein RU07_22445 [Agrobacterium tumefaciens]MCI9868143.1 transglutaminase-like cysteine peptidase [Rhizobium skierniewicense]